MVMVYDQRIADLEGKISYGTLGILDRLMRQSDDNPNLKKNYLIINGGTIVRNCYEPNRNDTENLKAISYDFEQLRHYFEMYVADKSYMLIYFQPGLNRLIPEESRRKETQHRLDIDRLTRIVAVNESLQPNKLAKIGENGLVTYFGLYVSGTFAYRSIMQILRSTPTNNMLKIWLVSHCPIDYLLFDELPKLEIILSHTGKILTKNDLSNKVFKDNDIPFNRITYKIFGDKDYIRPACRNKPKALTQLANTKLRLKTEREIALIAKTKLGIDSKLYNWDM